MVFNTNIIFKVLLIRRLRKRLKRKQRECNIRPIFYNRIQSGESVLVQELRNDPQYHHHYFRMSKATFDALLEKVHTKLLKRQNHSRPILPIEKLAITLRYLATGNSQISLAMNYRVSPCAVGKIIRETMTALCAELEGVHLPKPTKASWASIAKDFEKDWNFPHCCGAIDGKHVRVRAPNLSGSMNFNYKGFFSMVLLAVTDAKYRFILVDIGASGSQSDGGVLARSLIGYGLQTNQLNFPDPEPIVGETLPYVIVADDAFPLRTNLLKPFPGKNLDVEKRIFNYRLSRARIVVENSFGILAARWRILHTAIIGEPDLVRQIIKTCVLLHNYLINTQDMINLTTDNAHNETILPGNWREEVTNSQLYELKAQGSNNYTTSAAETRQKFMAYFNGVGSVPWQLNMI